MESVEKHFYMNAQGICWTHSYSQSPKYLHCRIPDNLFALCVACVCCIIWPSVEGYWGWSENNANIRWPHDHMAVQLHHRSAGKDQKQAAHQNLQRADSEGDIRHEDRETQQEGLCSVYTTTALWQLPDANCANWSHVALSQCHWG